MPQTPLSNSTSYCSRYTFLQCYSGAIAGDLLRPAPNFPRPSYLAMLDGSNPAGKRLQIHLNEGAGEIESFCLVSKRYTPDDLNALTGVSQMLLHKLNAARGMWSLAQFLKPMSARPQDVPFAAESWEILKALTNGEEIFGLRQSAEAGLPSVVPPRPQNLVTGNVLGYAIRMFPNYQPRGLVNNPRRGDGV